MPSKHSRPRVVTIPESHPYIEAVLGSRHVEHVRHSVRPPAEPRSPWAPSLALNGAWVEGNADRFDVAHVHFGFEGFELEEITAFIRALARVGKSLFVTVHDLENPQLPLEEQGAYRAKLAALVRAADQVLTLTPGAAREIHERWGVRAVVVAHPPQFHTASAPLPDLVAQLLGPTGGPAAERPSGTAPASVVGQEGRALRAGALVKDARPNLDLTALASLARAVDDDAGWRLEILHHGRFRAGREAAAAELLAAVELLERVTAVERGRLEDGELIAWVASLDLLVLPYGHGTHSGLLELANDLGTRVLLTRAGHFGDQRPGLNIVADLAEPSEAAAALAEAREAGELAPCDAETLTSTLKAVRREHRELYRRAVWPRAAEGRAERKRVLVLAPFRHPLRQPHQGGLESHVWTLVRELRHRGHEVFLAAPEGSDFLEGAPSEFVYPPYAWPEGVPVTDAGFPPEVRELEQAAMSRAMEFAAAHPEWFDVVHNHTLHPEPLRWIGRLGVPMVTTVHTPPLPEMVAEFAALTEDARRWASVVAVSEHTQRSWDSEGVESEVVRNGVDTKAWVFGAGGDELCWFGRIVPEKGPHIAIAVAEALGCPLTLAGPIGDSEYAREQILPRLGRRPSGAVIRHVGALRQMELAELVGSSACSLITPLWDEPFGLVAAESLASGTPVVALRRGGLGEVFGRQRGVTLVDPAPTPERAGGGDDDALSAGRDPLGSEINETADVPCPERDAISAARMAEALVDLLPAYRDPEQSLAARWAARHDAVRRFSFERTMDRLEGVYERACEAVEGLA
ncbi:glycosyltransferase [Falsarthrobacter nasiphocae]|uniref:D-inositol 3-phosphate glycosyltransferase n=1 Tax=Falsarthrobacter nasiphocae TaxID=189863 RepID=A0AAE3YF27_9MICC|nr:glycosyltransferase [Falsarthrobacter nasiphocae]MDR6891527.1 glycosyltransferase involved in cell wall biosynthesis [Falsarthrobacter nasiphocae]